jgi:hypothetical protein
VEIATVVPLAMGVVAPTDSTLRADAVVAIGVPVAAGATGAGEALVECVAIMLN